MICQANISSADMPVEAYFTCIVLFLFFIFLAVEIQNILYCISIAPKQNTHQIQKTR